MTVSPTARWGKAGEPVGASMPVLPLAAEAGERVISLGSFAKILAPGMRLGWLHAHPRTVERAWTNAGVMGSGGALNPIGSLIANQMLSDGSLTAHLASLRATFAARVDTMCAALDEHCPTVEYRRPEGGYFMWLTLPESCPGGAEALLERTAVATPQLRFTLGDRCVAAADGAGQFGRSLRLSFAFHDAVEIAAGVRLLGAHIDKMVDRSAAAGKR